MPIDQKTVWKSLGQKSFFDLDAIRNECDRHGEDGPDELTGEDHGDAWSCEQQA